MYSSNQENGGVASLHHESDYKQAAVDRGGLSQEIVKVSQRKQGLEQTSCGA